MNANHGVLEDVSERDEDLPRLTALQRILLRTDGTVSGVLEAYLDEPLRMIKLSPGFTIVGGHCGQGDTSPGMMVLRRTLLFQGAVSGDNLAHVDCALRPGGLARPVVSGLVKNDQPVSRVLARHRVETLREVVAIGFAFAGDCVTHFDVEPASMVLFRQCCIRVNRQPVIWSTCKFPMNDLGKGR